MPTKEEYRSQLEAALNQAPPKKPDVDSISPTGKNPFTPHTPEWIRFGMNKMQAEEESNPKSAEEKPAIPLPRQERIERAIKNRAALDAKDPPVLCERCNTASRREEWEKFGGCPTWGCGGNSMKNGRREESRGETDKPRRPSGSFVASVAQGDIFSKTLPNNRLRSHIAGFRKFGAAGTALNYGEAALAVIIVEGGYGVRRAPQSASDWIVYLSRFFGDAVSLQTIRNAVRVADKSGLIAAVAIPHMGASTYDISRRRTARRFARTLNTQGTRRLAAVLMEFFSTMPKKPGRVSNWELRIWNVRDLLSAVGSIGRRVARRLFTLISEWRDSFDSGWRNDPRAFV